MDGIVPLIGIAFVTDWFLGDPQWFPHPVRFIGFVALWLERFLENGLGRHYFSGLLFTLMIVGGVWFGTQKLLDLFFLFHPMSAYLLSAILLYFALAARDLERHASAVWRELERGNLAQARVELSRIVGRDTADLPEQEIVRATVETVAENTVDGVLSPLFYAFLGGAPLAIAFKAVSTLDSMVGHKNERYQKFGWASARLDDLAGLIPARLSVLLFTLSAFLLRLDWKSAWKTGWQDGPKSPSWNAGYSEGAVAGALGIRLGGWNSFRGEKLFRNYLGEPKRAFKSQDIRLTIRLMYLTSFLAVVLGSSSQWFL